MKKQLLFHVFKLRLHKEYVSVLTLLEYHLILGINYTSKYSKIPCTIDTYIRQLVHHQCVPAQRFNIIAYLYQFIFYTDSVKQIYNCNMCRYTPWS